jgi:hypothetical protein
MAKTLSNAQQHSLLLILGLLTELSTSETRPTQKAALSYCTANLLDIVAPTKAPATAVTQAPPPAPALDAASPAAAPEPAVKAARSTAATKAAPTREANKARPHNIADTYTEGSKTAATAKNADAAATNNNNSESNGT